MLPLTTVHGARKCRHVSAYDLSETKKYLQTGAIFCERKGPTTCSISFFVGFIRDLGFRRIILKCYHESSTKSLQDAVTQACAGVEVIPSGPLEGDHMASGRVGNIFTRSEMTIQNTSNLS